MGGPARAHALWIGRPREKQEVKRNLRVPASRIDLFRLHDTYVRCLALRWSLSRCGLQSKSPSKSGHGPSAIPKNHETPCVGNAQWRFQRREVPSFNPGSHTFLGHLSEAHCPGPEPST